MSFYMPNCLLVLLLLLCLCLCICLSICTSTFGILQDSRGRIRGGRGKRALGWWLREENIRSWRECTELDGGSG